MTKKQLFLHYKITKKRSSTATNDFYVEKSETYDYQKSRMSTEVQQQRMKKSCQKGSKSVFFQKKKTNTYLERIFFEEKTFLYLPARFVLYVGFFLYICLKKHLDSLLFVFKKMVLFSSIHKRILSDLIY